MNNRVIYKKDKVFNTIYRIILFLCLAASAATVYGIIKIAVIDEKYVSDNTIGYMMVMTYGYYALVAGSAAAVLFSVLSYKNGSVISVFFRTVSSLGILLLNLCGITYMGVLKKASDIILKYGIDYIKTNPSTEDVGLTQAEFDKCQNIADNPDDNMITFLIIGIFLGAIIYFILSLTSLHSLFKQRKTPVFSDVPMDEELEQYYNYSDNKYNSDL